MKLDVQVQWYGARRVRRRDLWFRFRHRRMGLGGTDRRADGTFIAGYRKALDLGPLVFKWDWWWGPGSYPNGCACIGCKPPVITWKESCETGPPDHQVGRRSF